MGKLTLDLDPDQDVLIVWRIAGDRLVRECIAGGTPNLALKRTSHRRDACSAIIAHSAVRVR